jgi:hypothetical protein
LSELVARRPQVNLACSRIDALNGIQRHDDAFLHGQQPARSHDHIRNDRAFFFDAEVSHAAKQAIRGFGGVADDLGAGPPDAAEEDFPQRTPGAHGTALGLPPFGRSAVNRAGHDPIAAEIPNRYVPISSCNPFGLFALFPSKARARRAVAVRKAMRAMVNAGVRGNFAETPQDYRTYIKAVAERCAR